MANPKAAPSAAKRPPASARKLTEEEVREIRKHCDEATASYSELVRRYGVSLTTVISIKKRKSWAWLP
jgi:DNA invertase Pin-like site-specific DNA recombinase